MTVLRFPIAGVAQIVKHAKDAENHEMLDPEQEPGPGLILFGNEGVGLRSNGLPTVNFTIYADGADPFKVPFWEWYPIKRAIWGVEGGWLFVPLELPELAIARAEEWFMLEVTDDG